MRKTRLGGLVLGLAAVALVCSTALLPCAAAIKCWTNKEGVRECGNSVPPEFAQQSTETKDKFGVTVGKTGPAKTLEELAAEQAEAKLHERGGPICLNTGSEFISGFRASE